MKSSFFIGLITLTSLLIGQSTTAIEAVPPRDMLAKIKRARILDPRYSVDLTLKGKEATMMIERNPKASDHDCKIDAVLLSKTLIEAYPQAIVRVKVFFAKPQADSTAEITITAGDIKAYATKELDEHAFFESLELEEITQSKLPELDDSTNRASVVPGQLQDRRLMLLGHIQNLARGGVNVKPFLQEFDDIEKIVATADLVDLRKAINTLAAQLREQDELSREAKAPPSAWGRAESNAFAPGKGNFKAKGFDFPSFRLARERIRTYSTQGKDTSNWTNTLSEIKKLAKNGNIAQANQLLEQLLRSQGIQRIN